LADLSRAINDGDAFDEAVALQVAAQRSGVEKAARQAGGLAVKLWNMVRGTGVGQGEEADAIDAALRELTARAGGARTLGWAFDAAAELAADRGGRAIVFVDEAQLLDAWEAREPVAAVLLRRMREPETPITFMFAGSEPTLVRTLFGDGGLLEYDAHDFKLSPIDPQPWREGLRRAFRELGSEITTRAVHVILEATSGQPHRTMLAANRAHEQPPLLNRLSSTRRSRRPACARRVTRAYGSWTGERSRRTALARNRQDRDPAQRWRTVVGLRPRRSGSGRDQCRRARRHLRDQLGRGRPSACTDQQQVAQAIARAAAGALLGDARLLDVPEDRLSAVQQRTWLDLRRALGDIVDLLDGELPAERPPAPLIADVVGALAQGAMERSVHTALVLYGADVLIDVPRSRFTKPGELLWAMRSAAQGAPQFSLILAGGPATIDLTSDPNAAFYGWGRPLKLGRLDTETLSDAVIAALGSDRALALRVAELSEGLPRIARLLARWVREELATPAPGDPVGAAWIRLLHDQASSLRTATRLLADLHRVALPVCQALATGRAPYRAAHSSEVTRALRLLHAHGVCESPKPRAWRLTDPLLAAWLRGDSTRAGHGGHSGVAF
jgi:hypothetical protein